MVVSLLLRELDALNFFRMGARDFSWSIQEEPVSLSAALSRAFFTSAALCAISLFRRFGCSLDFSREQPAHFFCLLGAKTKLGALLVLADLNFAVEAKLPVLNDAECVAFDY